VVVKAKELKIGTKVVVREFGQKKVYELTHVKEFPRLSPTYGAAFIAVATAEWIHGVPGLGGSLDLDEEIEIED